MYMYNFFNKMEERKQKIRIKNNKKKMIQKKRNKKKFKNLNKLMTKFKVIFTENN